MPWDPTVESLVVAIHAALTPSSPTGEIVYFEGFFTNEEGHRKRPAAHSSTTAPVAR
jgi:hypothetical protein